MNTERGKIFLSLISLLFVMPAFAQEKAVDSSKLGSGSEKSPWAFAADAYYYILPAEENIITILAYADYNSVHFEARYNYEGKNTASLFTGYRFEAGNKLALGVTPMLGYVFGDIKGVIPAFKLDLAWKKFDFYSESEYVIDLAGSENNYFYTWSEVAISPFENFRTGISANRTRLYETPKAIQRGVFTQYSIWKLTAGVHYFNPFTSDSFVITTLGIEF
jgi:hypothetical protein